MTPPSLTKAAARRHLHTRRIECLGFHRDDGLWDIEGLIEDVKTYSFANHDRGGIAAGEALHRMRVRLTLDDELIVRAAEATTEAGPFSICGDAAATFDTLVGVKVGRGWRKAVLARMGGVAGCVHLVDLLIGPLATTAQQTVAGARAGREGAGGGKPALIDSCQALRADGPIVARQWPEHAVRPPAGGEEA